MSQIIGAVHREYYMIIDVDPVFGGYVSLAKGWTARLAWKNALARLDTPPIVGKC